MCHALWAQNTRDEQPPPRMLVVGRLQPEKITGKEHWELTTGIALPVAVPSFLGGSGLIFLLVQTYNIIMILACFFFSLLHLK